MNRRQFLLGTISTMLAARAAYAGAAATTQSSGSEFLTDVPSIDGNILLARPSDRSIAFNVFSNKDVSVTIAAGLKGRAKTLRTKAAQIRAGETAELHLDGLSPGSQYEYEAVSTANGKPLFKGISSGSFCTARSRGEPFTFVIQADSHLDDGCRTDIYQQTIANESADHPDFMIDMGDTSMAGKHPSRESAVRQYLAQRYYFGLIGHSVPSFLLIGNHDGEEVKKPSAAQRDGLAVWSCQQRKKFFSNPVSDRFYTGNDQANEFAGLLQNYYAWTWGDALFVVLDPYWTSTAFRGSAAGWNMSLGRAQYDWLTPTLRKSDAKYKLVFIHQLVGGLDESGRGGSEAASCFEWGGCELDGKDTFAKNRPGWAMPIHQLLVESGVNAVFHGHDHFFAEQWKDGILYQLAPQAAHRNYRNDHAAEYHYRDGNFIPNSGHLRVQVDAEKLRIEYIRSVPDSMARRSLRNREVAASVAVHSRHKR